MLKTPLDEMGLDVNIYSNYNFLYLLFESQNPEYISTVLKESQYTVEIKSKLQGYITGYCISHSSSTAKWQIVDENNDLMQSMIHGSSCSRGGMITFLQILNVTDYSNFFHMLFKLEHYTNVLSWLSLDLNSSDSDCISCDELSQLYRYCPKLQLFQLFVNNLKLNCTPIFSSLHLMTCLEILELQGIIIDDSSNIVSDGLR